MIDLEELKAFLEELSQRPQMVFLFFMLWATHLVKSHFGKLLEMFSKKRRLEVKLLEKQLGKKSDGEKQILRKQGYPHSFGSRFALGFLGGHFAFSSLSWAALADSGVVVTDALLIVIFVIVCLVSAVAGLAAAWWKQKEHDPILIAVSGVLVSISPFVGLLLLIVLALIVLATYQMASMI